MSQPDTRYVYGMHCTWNESIAKVGHHKPLNKPGEVAHIGIPCCPHCGSVLFEMESEDEWWANAQRYEDAGHPGYVAKLKWAKGKCFHGMPALEAAYAAAMDL